MNIRDLQYIVEVAKESHFAKAAKQLFVTQPALSLQIKKLEEELGVRIFERSNKAFLVTEIGKKIIKKAEEILSQVEEIKALAKNSIDPYSGELLVGAFPTFAPYFFPKLVKQVGKNFPKIKLLLLEEKSELLLQKLTEGKLDFIVLAESFDDKNLTFVKLMEEEFLLAVNPDHEFAKIKIVDPSKIDFSQMILLEEGHCIRDQVINFCSKIHLSNWQSFKATSLESIKQMVIAGSGITLIPQIAAEKTKGIAYVKLSNAPKRKIFIVYRKQNPKKELIEELSKNLIASPN